MNGAAAAHLNRAHHALQPARLLLENEEVEDSISRAHAPDDEWLSAMIRVAACTGLRRAELRNLRWNDVDLDNGFLHIRNRSDGSFKSKSGSERTVPLRSWLAMKGVPFSVISKIMGHSSTQVTEVYANVGKDVSRLAMKSEKQFERENPSALDTGALHFVTRSHFGTNGKDTYYENKELTVYAADDGGDWIVVTVISPITNGGSYHHAY